MKRRRGEIVTSKSKIVYDTIDLRRWCVEEAMRWPSYNYGGYGSPNFGGVIQGGYVPPGTIDANVIDRANKILAWVLAAS